MKTSRRTLMGGSLAAAGLAAAPGILHAQPRPTAARTVRAVLHGDIPTYDPIWTTADLAAYHGAMVYDTLFGADAAGVVKPQMLKGWGVSDDKLTYTFELRDGLRFSDNTAGDHRRRRSRASAAGRRARARGNSCRHGWRTFRRWTRRPSG